MIGRELSPIVLARRAVVYVRQSTGAQVQENRESQRRQYALVDLARAYGFGDVRVIDDDLGRSASGTVDRPGFRGLVGQVCEGLVGAVLCLEASRLARNGRDWDHLLELCGLVGTWVIDTDGVYDPSVPNDRLLLGLKGTMSEFELTLLRKRLLDCSSPEPRPTRLANIHDAAKASCEARVGEKGRSPSGGRRVVGNGMAGSKGGEGPPAEWGVCDCDALGAPGGTTRPGGGSGGAGRRLLDAARSCPPRGARWA